MAEPASGRDDEGDGPYTLIRRAAHAHPDRTAVESADGKLSYAQLMAAGERVAAVLTGRGIGRGDRVLLGLPRSADLVAGVLAILRVGAVFVPVDPRTPEARVRYIATDSEASLAIVDPSLADPLRADWTDDRVLTLDDLRSGSETIGSAEPGQGGDLAYVLYTSGSTGRPKGVAITCAGLVGYLRWSAAEYRMDEGTGAPWFTSIGFDLTLTTLLGPLTVGNRIVVVPQEDELTALAATLRRTPDFSFVKLTPQHLDLLAELLSGRDLAGATRCLVIGGDVLRSASSRFWAESAPHTRLINEYGPTETVVGCVTHEIRGVEPAEPSDRVPIGRPIGGTTAYVLDPHGRPVSDTTAGELYIGGGGTDGWYTGRPGLTAQRFVPDPFDPRPGRRLYRTGDRCRWRPDGTLDCLGRLDDQVKIRGQRVEPGEVAALLKEHPAVRAAAVTPRRTADRTDLVAFVAGVAGQRPEPAELLGWLSEQLPETMVPGWLHVVDELPVTANGKLDRTALAAMAETPVRSEEGPGAERPGSGSDEAVELLCTIVAGVLGQADVDPDDDFYALGGDSIRAIQLVARARKAGFTFSLRDVVEQATAAKLTRFEDRPAAGAAPPPGAADEGGVDVPLTPIQSWFFGLGLTDPSHWNQALEVELRSGADEHALRKAFVAVIAAHDAFRLRYRRVRDRWEQYLVEDAAPSFIRSAASDVGAGEALRQVHASLDLEAGPVVCAVYAPGDPGRSAHLTMVAHHLVVDAVSWQVVLDDLATAYRQVLAGRPPRVPVSGSFRSWACALSAYATSPGMAAIPAPKTSPAPGRLRYDHAAGNNSLATRRAVEEVLDTRAMDEVQAALRGADLHLDELLLGAFVAALSSTLGCSPPQVDVERHGRSELSDELGIDVVRTVGWLTALFPVRLADSSRLDVLVGAARDRVRAAPSGGAAYGLARYLGPRRPSSAAAELPEPSPVLFNFRGAAPATLDAELGWRLTDRPTGPEWGTRGRHPYLLEYQGFVRDGELRSRWMFSTDRYRVETVRQMAVRMNAMIGELDVIARVGATGSAAGLEEADLARVLSRYGSGGGRA